MKTRWTFTIWLWMWRGRSRNVELSRYYDSSPCRWRAAEGSFCLLRPAPAVCVRKKSNEWRAGSRAGGCLVPDVIGIDSNWSLSNSTQIKIDTSLPLYLKTRQIGWKLILFICKDMLIIKLKSAWCPLPSLYVSAASGLWGLWRVVVRTEDCGHLWEPGNNSQ